MASARRESVRNLLCLQTTVIIIFSRICVSYEDEHKWIGPNFDDAGKIKLRNLDATTDHRTFEFDDGYVTDNRQDPVSPEMLGGIIIQHESQKLSARLRWLSNDEIGITNMQVCTKLNNTEINSNDIYLFWIAESNNKLICKYLCLLFLIGPTNFRYHYCIIKFDTF